MATPSPQCHTAYLQHLERSDLLSLRIKYSVQLQGYHLCIQGMLMSTKDKLVPDIFLSMARLTADLSHQGTGWASLADLDSMVPTGCGQRNISGD